MGGFALGPWAVAAVGLAAAAVLVVVAVRWLRCRPADSEVLVITGRHYKDWRPDGELVIRPYRIVSEGWTWCLPFVEGVARLSMAAVRVTVQVERAYSRGNGELDLEAEAVVRVSRDPDVMERAVERYLGQGEAAFHGAARDVLEAQLRLGAAELAPEDLDRGADVLARRVNGPLAADLEAMGLELVSLAVLRVSQGGPKAPRDGDGDGGPFGSAAQGRQEPL